MGRPWGKEARLPLVQITRGLRRGLGHPELSHACQEALSLIPIMSILSSELGLFFFPKVVSEECLPKGSPGQSRQLLPQVLLG